MPNETPSRRDEAVAPAGLMILVSIIVAAGCVWFGIAQGDTTPASLAKAAGSAWLGLSIVLPLGLASYLWLDFQHTEVPEFYRNEQSAMTICVGGGGGGGMGANIFFLLVTMFLPSIFADEDPIEVQTALLESVGWTPALILLLSSLAVGYMLGKMAPNKVHSN